MSMINHFRQKVNYETSLYPIKSVFDIEFEGRKKK